MPAAAGGLADAALQLGRRRHVQLAAQDERDHAALTRRSLDLEHAAPRAIESESVAAYVSEGRLPSRPGFRIA
ncbi:hypothetical protein D3C83_217360 [compost metagenome]